MKNLFLLTFMFGSALFALAQDYDAPVRNLSDDEIRLIQAYRQNPEPFRRVLYAEESGRRPMEHREHPRPMGPRDVIDVTIEGGSVLFFGRNYAYDPVSFRISREEEMDVVFRRQNSSNETSVHVSYRSDGLHFDVPDPRPGSRALESGYLFFGEDERWKRGEAIVQAEKVNGSRSHAKADHLTFHIRYASARP
jgi:hypothetical protein